MEEKKALVKQRVNWAKRVAKRDFNHLKPKVKVVYENNVIYIDFKNKKKIANGDN